ncbi:hypothetical protein [Paraglaciecola hydrolytica]|uniref:STAS/SEC14 domain-containing protein n=1 Tax=Paraglaciecola hydrolytica TaxID=1799789 RepID=A0A136A557_9ALTE|nr:hypothetical protein [Paraglaciecola hydrolytica]KXI30357.1 hypothetical protein AX660_10310 [Paraglaciecola hydrolytica]
MFEQHGKFQLACEQNIIIFIAEGAWNYEASLNATTQIKYIIDRLEHKQHAFIFETQHVEGMTPDAFSTWSDAVNYWLEHGFRAIARVTDPSESHYKMFIEPFDLRLKDLMPLTFTDDLASAVNWLHGLGYRGFEQGIDLTKFVSNQ